MTINDDIQTNLDTVQGSIACAVAECDRPVGAVQLIAVSKVQPIDRVRAAVVAGHRLFGENRVQEALARWQPLRQEFDDIAVHLIGPLQTNKARDAVAFFDAIHTLDRPRLAAALAREMDRLDRRPDCYIEVNTGKEPQKAGIFPSDADQFIDSCLTEYGLPVAGLMCIPPANEEPALHFALLREIAKRNGLVELSMGMSGDYQTAIGFDATLVRVGTAVFGARKAD